VLDCDWDAGGTRSLLLTIRAEPYRSTEGAGGAALA